MRRRGYFFPRSVDVLDPSLEHPNSVINPPYAHEQRTHSYITGFSLFSAASSSLQVPLFQNTEIGFTKLLALSIKPVLYLSGEYIVRKGDIGSEVRMCSAQFVNLRNFEIAPRKLEISNLHN